MDTYTIKGLLKRVKNGEITIHEAINHFRGMPFNDIGFAKIDGHRHIRCGIPEAIYCQGKGIEQIVEIVDQIVKSGANVLATKANDEIYKAVLQRHINAQYNKLARTITIVNKAIRRKRYGLVLIITAGTSDIPVAEEARVTLEIMGNRVKTLYDVGVAGIHRLLKNRNELMNARVIIVVAGMEGALASVVGGLVNCPVIGVPTSIGYGSSFGGLAPLLSMLNSCAPSVAVVNIDNGFGAACVATLINQR